MFVCSNKPKPSVQKSKNGHQYWKREVYHIAHDIGEYRFTLCGRECDDWIVLEGNTNMDLCKKCQGRME